MKASRHYFDGIISSPYLCCINNGKSMRYISLRIARVIILLIVLGASSLCIHQAQAAPLRVNKFQQIDSDTDGRPDKAVINCACVTEDDEITVFDGGNSMHLSDTWQQGTDFIDDTWIFDIGSRGRASLIIVFSSNATGQVARLYDDTTGDRSVAYHVTGKKVLIDESPNWSLQVSASSWVLANGRPNQNLTALLDRPAENVFEFIDKDFAKNNMKHDGVPDVEYSLVDENMDGAAEYFMSRALTTELFEYDGGKARLWYNTIGTVTHESEDAMFWPLLRSSSFTAKTDKNIRFFDVLPTVTMDWDTDEIKGFLLPGYPIGAGYWLNSRKAILDDRINSVNYEVPHAWYDLAQDHDAYPDLNIRLFDVVTGQQGNEWQEIRYSWNQFNPGTLIWDYKLGMMDYHPIENVVQFPHFSLKMVPYEQLPHWVTGNSWRLTTFVARETGNSESSEGIYAWTPWEGIDPLATSNPGKEVHKRATDYLEGIGERSPASFFGDIWRGYRGEYNFTRPLNSELYYSAIDHRLHLKGAEEGLYNMGDDRYLRYSNMSKSDYIDSWSLVDQGKIVRQLFHTKTHLIYANEDQIVFKNGSFAPSLFETLPPRDHKEWQMLGAKLTAHQAISADDFSAMFNQFSGKSWSISNAKIRDFRLEVTGYRFIIDILPGTQVLGSSDPSFSNLKPGSYVVTYRDDFEIEPLVRGNIVLDLRLADKTAVVKHPSLLLINANNNGSQDIKALTLSVLMHEDNHTVEIGRREVDLLSDRSLQVELNWTPLNVGNRDFTVQLINKRGRVVGQIRKTENVVSASKIPIADIIYATSGGGSRIMAGAMLLIMCIVIALVLRVVIVVLRPERVE